MSPEEIKEMIQAAIPDSTVEMKGEDCSFAVTVTSPVFDGMTPIQRHRMVNDVFKGQFASGDLHALSIKTLVPNS